MRHVTSRNQLVKYTVPLNMNGLRGRMLRLPPPVRKKREILFVYGQQSSLECWWGLLKNLNRYGGVTATDLPGFGGMESLYKVGRKPTIDTLADYLAAFIKLRFKRRRIVVVGEHFGFAVLTRMLERYPDIARRVDLAISLGGFARHDDLTMGRLKKSWYRLLARWFSGRVSAWGFKHLWLWPRIASRINLYSSSPKAKSPSRLTEARVELARQNHGRTFLASTLAVLALDNCRGQLPTPLWHVAFRGDTGLNAQVVEQHLKIIYANTRFSKRTADIANPLLSANPKTAVELLPPELRSMLAKLSR